MPGTRILSLTQRVRRKELEMEQLNGEDDFGLEFVEAEASVMDL